jgi:MFS family permease
MIIKKLKPARYLAGLTFCWGIVATFSAWVNSFGALVGCRLLLGLLEAGFFPGVVLYLSMFYGRRNLALRIAYFYSTAAISGLAGGLVAYGIGHMDGAAGWSAWRWIILINGIPTIFTGIAIVFVLPNSPETCKFLSEEDLADLKKIHDVQLGRASNLRNMEWADVKDGMLDWTTYAYCFALFPLLTMLYSFVVFLPTIISQMGAGWSPTVVQAMTVPVYAFGAIIYLICARLSDLTQKRGYFIMGAIISSMVGYGMLLSNNGTATSYAGTFFVAVGIFAGAGISFAWVPTNNPRYGKRAFSTGMHLTIGNSSGVASPFLFNGDHAPRFVPGYSASIGLLGFSLVLNIILHLHFKRQNKLRDQGKFDHLMEGKTDIEIEAMGEKSPRFRFAI